MNRGFTLIEVIVTIVILSIIGIVAVPKLMGVLNNSKENLYNKNVTTIIDATKLYVIENMEEYKDENAFVVPVTVLCHNNLLVCPILNPITEGNMDGDVNVTVVNEKFNYVYVE